jgi:hypothetical protein
MKKLLIVLILIISVVGMAGCSQADTASRNLSQAADSFEITRRIVFYNGITGEYMLTIEGLCSLGNYDTTGAEISVTCKVSPTEYKKHYLGLSDNVTYFAEQIDGSVVDAYHYRVIFRPSEIIPDIDLQVP